MRPVFREHLEALLLAERDKTSETLRRTEADEAEPQAVSGGATTRVELTQAEAASDTAEQEADFAMATRTSAHLARIDDALRALAEDPDGFVRCQRCGAEIDETRLQMVPWSGLCTSCARADGRGNPFLFAAER